MTTATCAADEPGLPAAHKQDTALAADAATADIPGTLHAHERVLLHGQPCFGADRHQVADRLPATLHAVAVDRPYTAPVRVPLWRTFLAEQRALLRELDKLVFAVPSVQAGSAPARASPGRDCQCDSGIRGSGGSRR